MARSLSAASVSALLAQQTGEAFLLLLTISDSSGVIARMTSDSVDTVDTSTSPNTTYTPYPFDLSLPKNVDGQVSSATLTLDNVSRTLIESIRTQTEPLQIDMKVVLGSDPTDVMVEFTDYVLRGVSYDAVSISGTLSLEDFMKEPVGKLMTGSNYPGLFYT